MYDLYKHIPACFIRDARKQTQAPVQPTCSVTVTPAALWDQSPLIAISAITGTTDDYTATAHQPGFGSVQLCSYTAVVTINRNERTALYCGADSTHLLSRPAGRKNKINLAL